MPVPKGTLTFNEVCEEACRNTSIEPSIMKAAVAEYMKTVQANVLKGFRVTVTPLSSKAIRQRTETLPEIKEDEI